MGRGPGNRYGRLGIDLNQEKKLNKTKAGVWGCGFLSGLG